MTSTLLVLDDFNKHSASNMSTGVSQEMYYEMLYLLESYVPSNLMCTTNFTGLKLNKKSFLAIVCPDSNAHFNF